ncbi:hypothetical protein ACJMK2_012553 [Sinanodonta woodiana]|uniref:C3H1-type domain-containing protein n=1 Tax=Sinanodonta woodiana TaxID=1069815 RepID=A0ABD3VAI9_SINWO
MASRSSKQRSVPYDLDNPFNWTTLHLKRKLECIIGIKRQLYMDNAPSTSSRPADHVQRQSSDSPSPQAELSLRPMEEVASPLPQLPTRRGRRSATIVNAHSAQISNPAETAIHRTFPEVRVTSNMAAVPSTPFSAANIIIFVDSMQRSITDLTTSITTIMARQHPSFSEFSLNNSTHVSTLQASQPMKSLDQLDQSRVVSLEILPAIDVVSESHRNQILEGKHVNLATLLLPHFELDILNPDVKATKYDPRLLKHLSISEFITAFGKYKRIISSVYPNRRHELDMYEADIIKISNAYRDIFYDYHNVYSTQAGIALRDYKVKVNWAIRNQATLQLLIGGRKSKSSNICNSVSHSTDFCPQTTQTATPMVNLANRRKICIDKYGWPKQMMDVKELCNNFNSIRGCHRTTCQFLHTCNQCRANTHGATACPHNTHFFFLKRYTQYQCH